MKVQKPIAFVVYMLGFYSLYAANPSSPKVQNFKTRQASFVENKGQLADENGRKIPDIKYYIHDKGVNVYCRLGKISFVFSKTENDEKISEATGTLSPAGGGRGWISERETEGERGKKTTINRADLILLNSNPASQILASDQQEYYENYYTAYTPEQGITHVHTFKTITYKSIYPNIDMVLHAKEGDMKYEFVVYPGGKVSDIRIQWDGVEKIEKLKDLKIEYSFALGKMEESKPVSFQDNIEIRSDFNLNNNRIGFDIGKYDKSKTLVIDPTLEWGTYFGGSVNDYGFGIATDRNDNVYISGYTESRTNIATNGGYQTSFTQNTGDAFLAKFSKTGTMQWATYYGSGVGYGVATDSSGNVYITGSTTGSPGFATNGAYQANFGGVHDAFLAQFNSSGLRLWSTYFGGNLEDEAFGVATDGLGNVFITGRTNSSSGIATNGAYQISFSSSNTGYNDAFLAKFKDNGKIQWATYFGGKEDEFGYGVASDGSGNIYMSGTTKSTSGISTNGAYLTSNPGNSDLFLSKFDGNGQIKWSTYYAGENDGINRGICTDNFGNIFITGGTSNSSGIATNGAYQTSRNGNSDAFLAKFDSTGKRLWATYFGGSGDENGISVSADHFGNIYFTGFTTSISDIATKGSFLTSPVITNDMFLAKFTSAGTREWSTYFYGNNNGENMAIGGSGNLFIVGSVAGSGIATNGAYQTSNAGDEDAFLIKFGTYENDAGIASIYPKDSFCPGYYPIKVQLKNFGDIEINSAQIGLSINGKIQKTFSWSGNLSPDSTTTVSFGNYLFSNSTDTIKVWTSLPNGTIDSFPQNDTAISVVYVSTLPKATAGPDTTLCYNETYTMQGAGGITYLWTPAKYLSNDTIPAPKAAVPNTQLYTLYVRNKYGCEDSANVLLKVKPKLQAQINVVPSPICSGSLVSFSAIGWGGDTVHYVYAWPHDSLKGNPVTKKIYQSGWHTVVLTDGCSGLPGLDSVYIAVTPRPKADFTILNRKPYLPDTTFRFQNQSKNASNYLWTFGDSGASNTIINPVHIYTDSGTYKITLIAYGTCTNDTGYGYIHIFSKYINIFIPDAFSPNGDGINDEFLIKGVGFNDYNFTIYNRWGELIYASPQPSPTGEGARWDGTLRNEPVPTGVYQYMIIVTDQFGIKHYFSGNLTLMR